MSGVDHHDVVEGRELGQQLVGLGVVGDVDVRGDAGDDPTIRLEIVPVAQHLEGLDAENEIGAAGGDDVGVDLRIAVPQVRLHRATALGHAVDLGLLEVKSGVERRVVDDECDREYALASDAGEDDVLFHHGPLSSPRA